MRHPRRTHKKDQDDLGAAVTRARRQFQRGLSRDGKRELRQIATVLHEHGTPRWQLLAQPYNQPVIKL